MMRRLGTTLATTAVVLLAVSGCAAGASGSSLRVVYDSGDGERTLTFSPDRVTCQPDRVSGIALSNDPQGRMSIRLDGDRRASVGAAGADGLVLFEGTELSLSADGDVLVVEDSPGEVAIIAGWTPDDDVDVQPDDAERFDATLSGRITCEEQVSLPESD